MKMTYGPNINMFPWSIYQIGYDPGIADITPGSKNIVSKNIYMPDCFRQ